MATALKLLGSLLGLNGGGSILHKASGLANHVALAAAASWVFTNPDEVVSFNLTRITLAVIVALAWFVLELNRRSSPRRHYPED